MSKKQKLAMLLQRQQALVDAAKNAHRSLSDTEQADFDDLQRQIDALNAEIEAEERQQQTAAPAATATAPTDTPAATGDDVQRAIESERTRISDITALCRDFDMDPADFIRNGTSLDNVRAAILTQLQANGGAISRSVQVTGSGEDEFRRDAADAIRIRSARVAPDSPSAGARQMASMSLRDLGIECLSREGGNTSQLLRMSPDALYTELARQFYSPTAAFPAILDDAIEKSIVKLYQAVPTTFQEFTTKGTLRDFKQTADHRYLIGGGGDFEKVPEGGELKHDLPKAQLLPQRKLDTYGKQFTMSRQAFINDDIGFLTEVPALYSAKAKQTIDKQVYKLLFDNSPIFDGQALFGTAHNNLVGTGTKPDQTAIQNIILMMQQQRDPFGEAIYIVPRTMVVPMGYEFDLTVVFRSTQVTGSNNNDVNPLYNYPLKVVQSPVLNALAGKNAAPWFMVADPISAPGIQVDYLNGQETPTFRRMETPGQLGFVWDIYLDWGITVLDWRGIAKNPGVKIEIAK